jgi:hypothetical protein
MPNVPVAEQGSRAQPPVPQLTHHSPPQVLPLTGRSHGPPRWAAFPATPQAAEGHLPAQAAMPAPALVVAAHRTLAAPRSGASNPVCVIEPRAWSYIPTWTTVLVSQLAIIACATSTKAAAWEWLAYAAEQCLRHSWSVTKTLRSVAGPTKTPSTSMVPVTKSGMVSAAAHSGVPCYLFQGGARSLPSSFPQLLPPNAAQTVHKHSRRKNLPRSSCTFSFEFSACIVGSNRTQICFEVGE